ncbi:MAG TPA: EVE domain-containing protein [Bacteroidetes bacterium]|nr:EVE domain-containing protein [Bacteroidota bacterium]HIL57388.1 EVE domain-containing protein [Rhodothermales bacterium]
MQYWIWSVPPDALAPFVRAETFALHQHGRSALQEVRPGDRIFAYVPGSRTLAALAEAVGEAFEDTTALVLGRHLPHRVRVRILTVLPEEAWVPYDGFAPHLSVLGQYPDEPTADRQFRRVVQRVLHPLPAIDGKVLEFLVAARAGEDPEALMEMVEAVRETRRQPAEPPVVSEPPTPYDAAPFDLAEAVERLIAHIEGRGFVYAPWHVAAFVTALRTRPLVLLAGVTGVGKSRLPQLIAEATGAHAGVLPVRPDWTDPSETLGFRGLDGRFRAGGVLRAAREAAEHPDRQHLLVLDEMNLARPEHYLADVLSRMENRTPVEGGGGETSPLLSEPLVGEDAVWQAVRWGPNLGLVGTVNVDESAHAFSRKVLDRAFTLELSAPDLGQWEASASRAGGEGERWPVSAWQPRALRLARLGPLSDDDRQRVERAVRAVAEADAILAPAGLGVGYRSRDEIALFSLHAADVAASFRTREGAPVGGLDLALAAKLLPRLDGAGSAVREATARLFVWAAEGRSDGREHDAVALVDAWRDEGRPDVLPGAPFPRTAARLARLVDGVLEDGVAAFWA